jgi:uncharacterized protein YlzI (FlbEa/FlbD family)
MVLIYARNVVVEASNTGYAKDMEVDHIEPNHYKDLKISPLEVIEANPHLTWSLSNAIKYVMRAGRKANNPILQDLKKAQWYLNHEIERLEND